MGKFEINLKMKFNTRPTKFEVECKLFELLKNGFTLKSMEESDEYITQKRIKEKKNECVGKR
tara:strand:- start:1942 stop:2127 length:186 start_codon:yes stop_codon:yes gene_type:complete